MLMTVLFFAWHRTAINQAFIPATKMMDLECARPITMVPIAPHCVRTPTTLLVVTTPAMKMTAREFAVLVSVALKPFADKVSGWGRAGWVLEGDSQALLL
jgi:hypothetical protein